MGRDTLYTYDVLRLWADDLWRLQFKSVCNKQLASVQPAVHPPMSLMKRYSKCWKLVHDRSPGRNTLVAQHNLGSMYYGGTRRQ